jgi:hypothetical protein
MYRSVFILAIALTGIVIPAGCNKSGGVTAADAKEVALDPQKYTGQTLESDLRLDAFESDYISFKDPMGGGWLFGLKSPNPEMTDKVTKACRIAGDYGSVAVTYKVDDTVSKCAHAIGAIVDVSMK